MSAAATDDDERLALGIRASLAVQAKQKACDMTRLLCTLERVAPILQSFIDENCALAAPAIGTEESVIDLWHKYSDTASGR